MFYNANRRPANCRPYTDLGKKPSRYLDQNTKTSSNRNEKYQDKTRNDDRPRKREPISSNTGNERSVNISVN